MLVVGEGELPAAVAAAVGRAGGAARRLPRPTDRELAAALHAGPARVAVVSHDDIQALRYALVAAHARPGVPLLATIFDRTVAAQILSAVPNSRVVSLADAVVPSLVAACLSDRLVMVAGDEAIVHDERDGGGFRTTHVQTPSRLARLLRLLAAQVRPVDAASRLLVAGVVGLLALLTIDTILLVAALDARPLDAVYEAVKTATTVGPNVHAERGPDWYRTFATAAMVIATTLIALGTAGLVNRLLSRRLTTIVGTRPLPRGDHVVVVGLGQVGLRLCLELRRLGLSAVCVERDPDARQVHLAQGLTSR